MKRIGLVFLVLAMVMVSVSSVSLTGQQCPAAKDRVLQYSTGHYLSGVQPIGPGFDPYGYNYQAHIFNGFYVNVYLGGAGFPPYEGDTEAYLAANPTAASHWAWPYRDDVIVMKWNDPWLANTDCNSDGKLDRHFGFLSYIGSSAWETNHQKGSYINDEGKKCEWTYFCKIVAAPADAVKNPDGNWYSADGTLIGPDIWGEFIIIEEIYNDPCGKVNGRLFISPLGPGFGKF